MQQNALFRHGSELYYWDNKNTGKPLVFIHGLACDHQDWNLIAPHFMSAHRVISYDLLGHGLSAVGNAPLSMPAFGEDIAALLEYLDVDNVTLIGHSMGCRVVLEAQCHAPQRVSRLVLIDGSRLGSGDPELMRQKMRQLITETGYQNLLQKMFDEMFTGQSDADQKQAVLNRTAQFIQQHGEQALCNLAAWDAGCFEDVLRQVTIPVLNIQCTTVNEQRQRRPLEVNELSPWGIAVRDLVTGSQIVTMAGVGHFPMLDQPHEINRLITEFLA